MTEYDRFIEWVYSDHEGEDISKVKKFNEQEIFKTAPEMSDGQFFRLADKIKWYKNWGVFE